MRKTWLPWLILSPSLLFLLLFTWFPLGRSVYDSLFDTRMASDNAPFVAATIDTVTRYVTLAGTAPDPAAYARRVADLLGPMTLPYTIGTPASFDYTGVNGRALADNVMDNVLSVLTNSPLGTGIAPDPEKIRPEFPYFTTPVTV